MKLFYTILIFTFCISAIKTVDAQEEKWKLNHKFFPNSSQIRKNEMLRIEAVTISVSGIYNLKESWDFDSEGNMLKYEKQLENALPYKTLYNYKNSKLVEVIQIGENNYRGTIDTVFANYKYINDTICIVTTNNNGRIQHYQDIYYKNGKIIYTVNIYGDSNDTTFYNINSKITSFVSKRSTVRTFKTHTCGVESAYI